MDDNKRKVKLKSCKKEFQRYEGPLLKPDVMLITKDVMVPLKLAPPTGKLFPSGLNRLKNKLRIEKTQRIDNQAIKLIPNPQDLEKQCHFKQSPAQVKKITAGKKMEQEKFTKFPSFHCIPADNHPQKHSCLNKRETLSLETKDLRLRSNSNEFHIKSVNTSNVETPPTITSPRNSMGSTPNNSEEIKSSSSSKFLQESLPKFPFNTNSSPQTENHISSLGPKAPFEQENVVKHITGNNNLIKNLKSVKIASKFESLNNPNPESGDENVPKEFSDRNLDQDINSDVKKLIIDGENERNEKERDERDFGVDFIEENGVTIEVEYLLDSLITNLETLENFVEISNSENFIDGRKETLQVFHESDDNLNPSERIPTMIEFRYSLNGSRNTVLAPNDLNSSFNEQGNVDLGRKYSWQELDLPNSTLPGIRNEERGSETVYNNNNNPVVINSEESNEQIEIKYSWQILNPKDQELSDDEKNSKLTSTEDLDLNEPEIQYSWQKLTSKYLSRENTEDNLTDTNQRMKNVNDISKNDVNTEYLKDYSPLRETLNAHSFSNSMKNVKKKEKGKELTSEIKGIERIAANSPINNIISSMLPEIKLINRRTSFNNTNPEILSNYKDNYVGYRGRNDSSKSSRSYSSVSSIKHVIANLNEMVTEQKEMLDNYVKNHKLDDNNNNSMFNPVEKVEIFPSTLHVLGNFILRDIRPSNINDQRNLLDSNNDDTLILNPRLDKPVQNISKTKIGASNSLNHPIPRNSDYYSSIFTTDHKISRKINDPKNSETENCLLEENRNSLRLLPVLGNDDRKLTEKNWELEIAEMEEIIKLSKDAGRSVEEKIEAVLPPGKKTAALKPRVEVSFRENKEEAGDNETRKDELLNRLEAAMKRLKQSEDHIDANWNLDYSVLDIEEDISEKEIKLPKKAEEHIKEIVKSAEEYLAKLEEQLNDLRNADDQIINSSERTLKDIDETYEILMDNLSKEINKRRNLLRLETEVFKYEGLSPLRACKQEVDAQIRSTQHLIVLTENMLARPITFNKERLGKIINATSHMGRIPAVPMPEELPYVTFGPPNEETKKEIVDRISCLGCVLRMGPAQFTEINERPACLELKWNLTDPEYACEEQIFIVQKALGEINEPISSEFETVYIGSENSCFVRDLPIDCKVTLRVGIQVTDTAWSVHRIAKTSIPAYNWDVNNSDYLITNNGRIATKVTRNLSTLLSRSAQFSSNHIIEFKFLEAASGSDEEGIGLVFEPGGVNDSLKRIGGLLITPNGNIFMNGEQKLMQLPKMELGTRMIFTSEKKDDETLRMTIECSNKAVTYDWIVATPLHFAVRFLEHNKWNLMVK